MVCNCYKEGKTSEPPHKEYIRESIEGLELDLPWEENQDAHNEFYEWTQSLACAHEDMELCSERLANISGLSSFKALLERLGREKYPVISGNLPVTNGGFLSVDLAQPMLDEILRIEREPGKEKRVYLFQGDEHLVSSAYIRQHYIFAFEGDKNFLGLNSDRFFILNQKKFLGISRTKKVFESTHFKIKARGRKQFEYIDIESGKSATIGMRIGNRELKLSNYTIETRATLIREEYAYIIDPLKRLVKASIESGNPIIWC